MQKKPRQIIIHLVHGTWANSWLKLKDAWFEDTSLLTKRLLDNLPANVKLNSFYWSGKNSVKAREEAAVKLASELSENANSGDGVEQIILAHSHGGTLAYEALKKTDRHSNGTCSVKGLICMATPFVSVTRSPNGKRLPMIVAIAGLLDALFWTVVLASFPAIIFNTTLMMIMVPVITLLSVRLLALMAQRQQTPITDTHEPSVKIPIYLLRATRDEASLSLGLMQTFAWISSSFGIRREFSNLSYRKPATIVGFGIVYFSSMASGLLAAKWASEFFNVRLDKDACISLALLYSYGFAGLIYLLGYMSLALSVGHFEVLQWLNSLIEVEASPSGTPCKIKVYSSLNGVEGLRHGLYMSSNVVGDVIDILRELTDESSPLS